MGNLPLALQMVEPTSRVYPMSNSFPPLASSVEVRQVKCGPDCEVLPANHMQTTLQVLRVVPSTNEEITTNI